jgi:diaminopimelate decarboxylase
VLLATVLYKKQSGGKTFLVTDAAMNDLIRPSLYGAYQAILNCEQREGMETVDVVGPICESGDFFAKDRELSTSERGDVLSVMSAGAYGMSMASRYNSRMLPAEVLITAEGVCRLIRARDTFDDLIRNELV